MKKISLESLKVTSFITTINAGKSKTIKGGEPTFNLTECDPHETDICESDVEICQTDSPNCDTRLKSVVRICRGTVNSNCPRSGTDIGTNLGCTMIC